MNKLYSALNEKIALIANCEDEPIQFLGSIQPHGFLLIINQENSQLVLCSANTDEFLNHPPQFFLSKLYKDVLPTSLVKLISGFSTGIAEKPAIPDAIHLYNRIFNCFIHNAGSFIYCECILTDQPSQGLYDAFSRNTDLLKEAAKQTTLQELCSLVAKNIREIIGFERVMIYKFDEMYNGHVYAESIADNIDSFLGLHYPNTDIPKQARDLYLKNPVRLIHDVHYTPVPIVTLDAVLANPEIINLSDVSLRSVSPIHIQYLKNMDVGASMSISIIKGGKLWGLAACHHSMAKSISFICQMQAYLLSQILSSQISVQETAEEYMLTTMLDIPLNTLMVYLKRKENFIELNFGKVPEINDIVNAHGAAFIYKNKIYTNGIVPPDEFIYSMQTWLDKNQKSNYHTNELRKDFPGAAEHTNIASGLLYQQLDNESKTALFWFRQSTDKVISWAGNPAKKELSALTPRNSFEAWKEIKKGISAEWKLPELNAAFRFSYLLQQHLSFLMHQEGDIKTRKLNEQLLKANKELENINWISTHDLKEPLRKIQMLASMINARQDMPKVENIQLAIEKIKSSAGRMQQFIDDLLRYSKLSGVEMAYETIDLTELIDSVLLDFEEESNKDTFKLITDPLPIIYASRFQVQQLFINLIDNAIKFKKDNQKQIIQLRYEIVIDEVISDDEKNEWHKITFSDTGVGLSKTMLDSIFDIFKRGRSDKKLEGTGVGLSICRKIMENHGGKIIAAGSENEGASFILYFPKT